MITIRKGIKSDLPQALELIKELAVFEKALHEVDNTVQRMEVDGFGEKPIYDFFVAEKNDEILGISIFYFRYSTWKGKRLYLEDLVVKEAERGSGIGKLLFEKTIEQAKLDNCTGMMWQVLDWNQPAIDFYKKYDTRFEDEWVNCSIDF